MSDTEVVVVETVTPVSTRATARGHTFAVDKPAEAGGDDQGPMASEYFVAALASCHVTTAHKIAEKRRRPLDHVAITGTAFFAHGLISRIVLDIAVRGECTEEELDTVFRLTERACTISRATSVPIERDVRLVT